MHLQAVLNGEIVTASELSIPTISPAVLYGRGIFTTIAVYQSKPFQWEKHWHRLLKEAEIIGIDLNEISENKIRDSLFSIISQNKIIAGRARITFFDLAANSNIWKIPRDFKTAYLITTADFRQVREKLRLTVSPFPVNSASPLAGLKTCNYLENSLASEEAAKRGFDEAIRTNEKSEIVSATMANVFWTSGGKIFTPPVSAGAVAGTTRAFVMEHFQVSERFATTVDLVNADEILLTSAGIGIAPVESFEEKMFKTCAISDQMRLMFDKRIG